MTSKKTRAAIAYFEDAIRESDEIIADCTPALQAELEEQKGYFAVALEAMRRAPLPEDNPLTLEELRGMDGEPVYIICAPDADGEQLCMWALVEVDADDGAVYLTNNLGGRTEFLYPEELDGMAIYRRPPEKGE